MNRPEILLSWARYYAPLVALFLAAGAAGGAVYLWMTPTMAQASTTVVETGDRIPPLQLDSVARALFKSAVVYVPAMEELGRTESPEEFLRRTQLRPVADTTVLRVIGRAEKKRDANEISRAMAESLIEALNEQRQRPLLVPGSQEAHPDFILFSGPEADPGGGRVVTSVAWGVGASVGFLFGVAVSVIHFAWRGPLLTLKQAIDASGAHKFGVIRGRWPAWLGVFRPRLRWRLTARNRVGLARLGELFEGGGIDVEPVGVRPKRREVISRQFVKDLEVALIGDGAVSVDSRRGVEAGRGLDVSEERGPWATVDVTGSPQPIEQRMKLIVAHAGAPSDEVDVTTSMLLGERTTPEWDRLALLWVS
jgi:hypothetical protein